MCSSSPTAMPSSTSASARRGASRSACRAGDPGVEFAYRLVTVRRGYEEVRLERAPWADDDPNLYPTQPAVSGEGGAR